MVQTPGGILVTPGAVDSLIKAEAKTEARKIAQEEEKKRGALFSQYLVHNMSLYGAREKPQGTPAFRQLYAAAKHSFIDAILIRARIDQQKRIWQRTFSDEKIGFKVVHERHDDPSFKGGKDIEGRCREMEAVISDPTPEQHLNFYPHRVRPHTRAKDLVAVLTRAELIIDRKVIRRIKRRDGQGYAAFHWLPGETIKNVDESMREWARKHEEGGKITKWTAERMSYATGFDIANCAYVQLVDGLLVDAFYPDEISVHISNPSDELNRFGYGESRLEISLDVTQTLMYAWNFNKEMFRTNYPEAILSVSGDYDKEGLQAFKQQLLGDTHGAQNYWRLPVIPADTMDNFKIEAHKLRDTPKDMLFDQFVRLLIMVKCAAYGAHPSTLNLQMDSGAGGSSLNNASPVEEIEFSRELSLIPSVTDMCEWLTDAIIKPRYNDLKLIVVGLEKDDKKEAVDIRSTRASKWVTKNEARMEENLQPIGYWVEAEKVAGLSDEDLAQYIQNPWNYPSDVPIANYINTFSMAQQGQDGDQGGDGDGYGDYATQDDADADNYYSRPQDDQQTIQKANQEYLKRNAGSVERKPAPTPTYRNGLKRPQKWAEPTGVALLQKGEIDGHDDIYDLEDFQSSRRRVPTKFLEITIKED